MSSRQSTHIEHIETSLLAKGLNFSIASNARPNKDIIATVQDKVKKFEKESSDTIWTKISLTLQNSKPPKDNLSKDECKALGELKSDTWVVVLPPDKCRSNHDKYLEKCMDHINNGPCQLLKKDPTNKIKGIENQDLEAIKNPEGERFNWLKITLLSKIYWLAGAMILWSTKNK